jgi:hypothetical protein
LESYLPLVKHLLPDFILSYYELLRVDSVSDILYLYLQEKNYEETDMVRKHLLSKGFLPEITIQDFLIRDKRVFLGLKPKVVEQSWSLNLVLYLR